MKKLQTIRYKTGFIQTTKRDDGSISKTVTVDSLAFPVRVNSNMEAISLIDSHILEQHRKLKKLEAHLRYMDGK